MEIGKEYEANLKDYINGADPKEVTHDSEMLERLEEFEKILRKPFDSHKLNMLLIKARMATLLGINGFTLEKINADESLSDEEKYANSMFCLGQMKALYEISRIANPDMAKVIKDIFDKYEMGKFLE